MKYTLHFFKFIIFFTLLCISYNVLADTNSYVKSKYDSKIEIILTTVKNTIKPNEKCPIILTFANISTNTLYIQEISGISFTLCDDYGFRVQGTAVPKNLTSSENVIETTNGHIIVYKALKIDPLSGFVLVFPDGLSRYHEKLKHGKYFVSYPIHSIKIYDEKDLMYRPDKKHKMWIRDDAPGQLIPVEPEITIINIE